MGVKIKIGLFFFLILCVGTLYGYTYKEYCEWRDIEQIGDFFWLGSGYLGWKPYKDLMVIAIGFAISVTALLIGVLGSIKKGHLVDYLLAIVGGGAFLVSGIQLFFWVLNFVFEGFGPNL